MTYKNRLYKNRLYFIFRRMTIPEIYNNSFILPLVFSPENLEISFVLPKRTGESHTHGHHTNPRNTNPPRIYARDLLYHIIFQKHTHILIREDYPFRQDLSNYTHKLWLCGYMRSRAVFLYTNDNS